MDLGLISIDESTDNFLRRGPWVKSWVCKHCEQELTKTQVYDSHGCCPLRGSISRGTVVDSTEISDRYVELRTYRPWWQFWKPRWETVKEYK